LATEVPSDPSLGIRIQKWLSIQGIASRREAEGWIEEGKVFVNGKLVTEQGMRIDPNTDKVTVLGRHINNTPPPRVYWLLNKPDMVLTSRPDGTGRMSIYDLHSTRDLQFLVSPVGRLDYRTEGLLLLSNDGELVHRLAHPKYKVPRYYNVLIDGRLSYEEESALRRGIELEDGMTGKSEVIFAHSVNLGQSRGSWYFITVFEGRNRLVRRMFEHFGFKVVRLVRYGFGDLRLPEDLPSGEYRQLTNSEIKYLKETVNLSGDV
jgi:23S rRNA pseudouridine2605 synthase